MVRHIRGGQRVRDKRYEFVYACERYCVHHSVLALTHPLKNVSGRAKGDLGWGNHPLNSGRHCTGEIFGYQVGRKTCAFEYPANNRAA